jgi:hypothetical protein
MIPTMSQRRALRLRKVITKNKTTFGLAFIIAVLLRFFNVQKTKEQERKLMIAYPS